MARHGTRTPGHRTGLRQSIADCEAALSPHVDWSLTHILRTTGDLDRVDVVQPALFAVMVSLARLWQSHGIHPTAVIGHSQGEIAAAHIAGALTLDDAARIAALRSQALHAITGHGGMAPPPRRRPDPDPPQTLRRPPAHRRPQQPPQHRHRGRHRPRRTPRTTHHPGHPRPPHRRRLRLTHPHVERIREQILADSPRSPPAPATSPSTPPSPPPDRHHPAGRRLLVHQPAAARPAHPDRPGRPRRRAHRLHRVQPPPVLTGPIQDTAEDADRAAVITGSLRRRTAAGAASSCPPPTCTPTASASAGLHRPDRCRSAHLPLPARTLLARRPAATGDVRTAGLDPAEHPLLGAVLPLAGGEELVLTGGCPSVRTPGSRTTRSGNRAGAGTALVELAVQAGDRVGCDLLDELTLQAPLVLPGTRRCSSSCPSAVRTTPAAARWRSTPVPNRPTPRGPATRPASSPWAPSGPTGTSPPGPRGRRGGGPRRPVPAPGRGRPGVRPGVPGAARAVAARRGALRRGAAAPRAAPGGRRVRPAPGPAGRGPARGRGERPGAGAAAVLLDRRDPARHRATALRVRLTPDGTQGLSLAVADAAGAPVAQVASLVSRTVTTSSCGRPGPAARNRCCGWSGPNRRSPAPGNPPVGWHWSAPTPWGWATARPTFPASTPTRTWRRSAQPWPVVCRCLTPC
ncbi:acyltransferase domain-containing protein [Streptacidiphilus sp. 4-A2]|nr:acyltransferase domain-containing protein [Streptacidiphilus sp. 4-A2]